MAKVLLVGSHPGVTRFAALRLETEGWDVVAAVGAAAGLAAIDETADIDAMVLGGPLAWEGRHELAARLNERSPYAPIVVATSPDGIGEQIRAAFGAVEQ
jgi:DNA-binding NtrC family response regulator